MTTTASMAINVTTRHLGSMSREVKMAMAENLGKGEGHCPQTEPSPRFDRVSKKEYCLYKWLRLKKPVKWNPGKWKNMDQNLRFAPV